MINRMRLIREVGGAPAFVSTLIVLLGCIAFPVFEFSAFGTLYCAAFVAALTTLGWLFRKRIMEFGAEYQKRTRVILFLYGAVLVSTKYLGGGYHAQLVVITIATAIMFNLNLWSVSEAVIEDRAESNS